MFDQLSPDTLRLVRARLRSLAYAGFGHLPLGVKLFINRRVNRTFLVGVLGVVRNHRGEVLILRHTYRPAYPYGVPGGWLKGGESLGDALKREISEETGLDVEVRRVLRVESYERPTRLDVWLECDLTGGEFRPSAKVSAAAFYAPDSLPELLPEQRAFLLSLPARD